MVCMYKIAVLGERDSVIGFAALGLSIFIAEDGGEAENQFKKIARSGEYAIIYVTETYAGRLAPEIAKYRDRIAPAVILIPGVGGVSGIGRRSLDEAVEKAVGSIIV